MAMYSVFGLGIRTTAVVILRMTIEGVKLIVVITMKDTY